MSTKYDCALASLFCYSTGTDSRTQFLRDRDRERREKKSFDNLNGKVIIYIDITFYMDTIIDALS